MRSPILQQDPHGTPANEVSLGLSNIKVLKEVSRGHLRYHQEKRSQKYA